jgi:hypothetical protein
MLDLSNPKSGSILVLGEKGSGKTQILRTMTISACMLNQPEDLRIFIISNSAREFTDAMHFPHCETVINSYDRAAGELVIELASISEQRRSGRERGAMMMLLIDDFASYEAMLRDYSVYLNLKSLITRGPASGVWPIIAINPNDVHEKRAQMLRSFGTYIFEKSELDPQYKLETGASPDRELMIVPNFDVIVGGRLVPIANLSV